MVWWWQMGSSTLSGRRLLVGGNPGLRRDAPDPGLEQFRPAGAQGAAGVLWGEWLIMRIWFGGG